MKTLEEILQILGCKKPFLNEVKIYDDGWRQSLTVKGNETYSKLIEILYAVGNLTETDMGEAIERLDDITNEMY